MQKSPLTPVHVNNALSGVVRSLRDLHGATAGLAAGSPESRAAMIAAMRGAESILAAFLPEELAEVRRVMGDYHQVAGPVLDANHRPAAPAPVSVPAPIADRPAPAPAALPLAALPAAVPAEGLAAFAFRHDPALDQISGDVWQVSVFRMSQWCDAHGPESFGVTANCRRIDGQQVRVSLCNEAAGEFLAELQGQTGIRLGIGDRAKIPGRGLRIHAQGYAFTTGQGGQSKHNFSADLLLPGPAPQPAARHDGAQGWRETAEHTILFTHVKRSAQGYGYEYGADGRLPNGRSVRVSFGKSPPGTEPVRDVFASALEAAGMDLSRMHDGACRRIPGAGLVMAVQGEFHHDRSSRNGASDSRVEAIRARLLEISPGRPDIDQDHPAGPRA